MKSSFKPVLVTGILLSLGFSVYSHDNNQHSSTNQQQMDTIQLSEKNKQAVRKLYEEILNTGKLEFLDQVIAEDYTGVRGEKGPKGFTETIIPVRKAFPDIKWTIEDLIAEDNKVVVKWSWKGTNTTSFNGFPVSQKEVHNSAIVIYQFNKGKIIQAWMQSDRLGFFQQIGVISREAITPPQPEK